MVNRAWMAPGRNCLAQEGKQARAYTPSRHEESTLRSMVMTLLSRPPGKTPSCCHWKSRRTQQAAPDPQQNGTMESLRTLNLSGSRWSKLYDLKFKSSSHGNSCSQGRG